MLKLFHRIMARNLTVPVGMQNYANDSEPQREKSQLTCSSNPLLYLIFPGSRGHTVSVKLRSIQAVGFSLVAFRGKFIPFTVEEQ